MALDFPFPLRFRPFVGPAHVVLRQERLRRCAIEINETVESGDFSITLLGLVSGRNLDVLNQDLEKDHTYSALAESRGRVKRAWTPVKSSQKAMVPSSAMVKMVLLGTKPS